MSTLSDGEPSVIVAIQVMIAKLEERVIFLKKTNDEIKRLVTTVRKEQETRFRWTIYLFITLLVAFLGLTQIICRFA